MFFFFFYVFGTILIFINNVMYMLDDYEVG